MGKTGLSSRLQRLEGPASGVRVVCLSMDAKGNEDFLWEQPCSRPAQVVTIRIPHGSGDPIISIEKTHNEES